MHETTSWPHHLSWCICRPVLCTLRTEVWGPLNCILCSRGAVHMKMAWFAQNQNESAAVKKKSMHWLSRHNFMLPAIFWGGMYKCAMRGIFQKNKFFFWSAYTWKHIIIMMFIFVCMFVYWCALIWNLATPESTYMNYNGPESMCLIWLENFLDNLHLYSLACTRMISLSPLHGYWHSIFFFRVCTQDLGEVGPSQGRCSEILYQRLYQLPCRRGLRNKIHTKGIFSHTHTHAHTWRCM